MQQPRHHRGQIHLRFAQHARDLHWVCHKGLARAARLPVVRKVGDLEREAQMVAGGRRGSRQVMRVPKQLRMQLVEAVPIPRVEEFQTWRRLGAQAPMSWKCRRAAGFKAAAKCADVSAATSPAACADPSAASTNKASAALGWVPIKCANLPGQPSR